MMTYLLCLFSFTDEFIQLIVTRGNEVACKIFTSVIGLSFFRNKFTVWLILLRYFSTPKQNIAKNRIPTKDAVFNLGRITVKQLTIVRYKIIHTTSLLSFFLSFFFFNTNAFAYLNYKITISYTKILHCYFIGELFFAIEATGWKRCPVFFKTKNS